MALPLCLRNLRYNVFYYLITKPRTDVVKLGDKCAWTIAPAGLLPESKVFCAGAGNDISFEKEVIQKFGSEVILVDPSPTGIATATTEIPRNEKLKFFPVALSDYDGTITFSAPADPTEGSFRRSTKSDENALELSCKCLESFMLDFGWNHIDLLKMDIEGSEYAVLDQILQLKMNVRQICVEFHHGIGFGHSPRDTVRTILSLRRSGYDLIHRVHWDHTFLRRNV